MLSLSALVAKSEGRADGLQWGGGEPWPQRRWGHAVDGVVGREFLHRHHLPDSISVVKVVAKAR